MKQEEERNSLKWVCLAGGDVYVKQTKKEVK